MTTLETQEQIEQAVLAWPSEARFELAEKLMESLWDDGDWQAGSDDRPLADVVSERVEDLISGRVVGIPSDEAHRMMREESLK